MSEIYSEEVNKRKAKIFFLGVLRNEGRPYLNSNASAELLSDILTDKLIEKLKKEKRK